MILTGCQKPALRGILSFHSPGILVNLTGILIDRQNPVFADRNEQNAPMPSERKTLR
jgi:hypothetical protein